jgi:hypothetical protein
VLANLEERRFGAFISEGLDDGGRVSGPRSIVEGQHHLVVAQEIVLLEMSEAEGRTAGRVDLDDARNTMAPGLSQPLMALPPPEPTAPSAAAHTCTAE